MAEATFIDVWKTTFPDFKKVKYADFSQAWTNTILGNTLVRQAMAEPTGNGLVRRINANGTKCEFTVKMRKQDSFTNPGLEDAIPAANMIGVFELPSVPWGTANTNASWFERAAQMNKGTAARVRIIKADVSDMHLAMIEGIETQAWGRGNPADERVILGVNHFITEGAAMGFTGMNPPGFAAVATLDTDLAANAGYRNYYYPIAGDITARKIVDAIRKCRSQIGWKKLVPFPNLVGLPRQAAYCNWETKELLAQAARETVSTNFDTGIRLKNDTVWVDDGLPVIYVPSLDDVLAADIKDRHPIFLIDWATWDYNMLQGFNFKTTGPRRKNSDDKYLEWRIDTDAQMAFFCVQRNRNALILDAAEQT